MRKRGKNKRGLSPVIATILLILIVVILAIIIMLWARGFIKEKVEKFGASVDKSCLNVNLDISIDGDRVYIKNNGNVPVYKINIKKQKPGTSDTQEKVINLNIGNTNDETILESPEEYDEIVIIPVLLGKADDKDKEYTCDERFGIECLNQDGSFIC